MSTYCPPMPHYARSLGITDCDYLQLDPYVKEQMRLQHQIQTHSNLQIRFTL